MRFGQSAKASTVALLLWLILLAIVASSSAGAQEIGSGCRSVLRALSDIVATTHELQIGSQSDRHGLAHLARVNAQGIEQLQSSGLSDLLSGFERSEAREVHREIVARQQRIAALLGDGDANGAFRMINSELTALLPRVVDEVSRGNDCDLRKLHHEAAQVASAGIAAILSDADAVKHAKKVTRPGKPKPMPFKQKSLVETVDVTVLFTVLGLALALACAYKPRKRRRRRYDIRFETVLHHSGRATVVRVMNIGTGGAKIRPNPGLRTDQEVALDINGDEVCAVVRWQDEAHAGMSFEVPLSNEQIKELRSANPA